MNHVPLLQRVLAKRLKVVPHLDLAARAARIHQVDDVDQRALEAGLALVDGGGAISAVSEASMLREENAGEVQADGWLVGGLEAASWRNSVKQRDA
ncbi:hypothetical protein AK830_g1623 [Neonectria ditissima]|uniref:Uncharacterized protein n=1 Tax=Neonectria ditissima TaxID=78410 RepID=A0A0P7BUA1_9HYPO|nr:hypothetical protein AK830_g1623 [Neonectria ditissima]